MKQYAVGLAAILFVGFAQAQSAPVQAPAAPQATQAEAGNTDTAAPAATDANGQPVPTVPQQSPKKNHTTLILGAVGAAALLGAASSSGDSDRAPAPNPQPAPSSP